MPTPRPTQRDIARAAGVTQATVSLALNNHPRLSAEIRKRIQAIARQLGYRPDPYLSGLSAYKKQLRPRDYQATLAWLTNWPAGGRDWRKITTFKHYNDGAIARAAELGYQLEDHDLAAPGMAPARMEQILKTRNIPGILLLRILRHHSGKSRRHAHCLRRLQARNHARQHSSGGRTMGC